MYDEALFRIKQFLLSIDQVGNCFIGLFIGGGWADETFSARCWRERRMGWIKFLDYFEADHCKLSFESERDRRHSPPKNRIHVIE